MKIADKIEGNPRIEIDFTVYQLFTEYQTKRAHDTSADIREHVILLLI